MEDFSKPSKFSLGSNLCQKIPAKAQCGENTGLWRIEGFFPHWLYNCVLIVALIPQLTPSSFTQSDDISAALVTKWVPQNIKVVFSALKFGLECQASWHVMAEYSTVTSLSGSGRHTRKSRIKNNGHYIGWSENNSHFGVIWTQWTSF